MNGNRMWLSGPVMLGAVFFLTACDSSGGGGALVARWVSGADVINQIGIYGTKGTASPSNVPGAREGAVSWSNFSGNLWLFGEIGYESTVTLDLLNDLWELTP
jgi:hypothetical protein